MLLSEGCCALGFFEEIEVKKSVISYKQEARILLFTDGLSEWLEEEYDDAISKIISCLQEHDYDNPEALLQHLLPTSTMLNGQKDDMCVVMLRTNAEL